MKVICMKVKIEYESGETKIINDTNLFEILGNILFENDKMKILKKNDAITRIVGWCPDCKKWSIKTHNGAEICSLCGGWFV